MLDFIMQLLHTKPCTDTQETSPEAPVLGKWDTMPMAGARMAAMSIGAHVQRYIGPVVEGTMDGSDALMLLDEWITDTYELGDFGK